MGYLVTELKMNPECLTSTESKPFICMKCKSSGKNSKLKFSYTNLNTGIWLCSSPKCCFPLNSPKVNNYIVKIDLLDRDHAQRQKRSRRKAPHLSNSPKIKGNSRAGGSSVSVSTCQQEDKVINELTDEKAKHLLSRVKYHELDDVERLQGDGQSTKSDCMTSISGSTHLLCLMEYLQGGLQLKVRTQYI
ncbi:uncharacterized protein LOC135689353 [Rhopilema esculentum]|uniref:uncharacterized protein LOC135689353 n=1 Tax=Rhopilema esculentum TaxID=499914 RepID=UPI0031DC239E